MNSALSVEDVVAALAAPENFVPYLPALLVLQLALFAIAELVIFLPTAVQALLSRSKSTDTSDPTNPVSQHRNLSAELDHLSEVVAQLKSATTVQFRQAADSQYATEQELRAAIDALREKLDSRVEYDHKQAHQQHSGIDRSVGELPALAVLPSGLEANADEHAKHALDHLDAGRRASMYPFDQLDGASVSVSVLSPSDSQATLALPDPKAELYEIAQKLEERLLSKLAQDLKLSAKADAESQEWHLIKQHLDALAKKVTHSIGDHDKTLAGLTGGLSSLQGQLAELVSRVDSLQAASVELVQDEAEPEPTSSTAQETAIAITTMEARVQTAEEIVDGLSQRMVALEQLQQRSQGPSDEVSTLHDSIQSITQQFHRFETLLEDNSMTKDSIVQKLVELSQRVDECAERIDDAQGSVTQLSEIVGIVDSVSSPATPTPPESTLSRSPSPSSSPSSDAKSDGDDGLVDVASKNLLERTAVIEDLVSVLFKDIAMVEDQATGRLDGIHQRLEDTGKAIGQIVETREQQSLLAERIAEIEATHRSLQDNQLRQKSQPVPPPQPSPQVLQVIREVKDEVAVLRERIDQLNQSDASEDIESPSPPEDGSAAVSAISPRLQELHSQVKALARKLGLVSRLCSSNYHTTEPVAQGTDIVKHLHSRLIELIKQLAGSIDGLNSAFPGQVRLDKEVLLQILTQGQEWTLAIDVTSNSTDISAMDAQAHEGYVAFLCRIETHILEIDIGQHTVLDAVQGSVSSSEDSNEGALARFDEVQTEIASACAALGRLTTVQRIGALEAIQAQLELDLQSLRTSVRDAATLAEEHIQTQTNAGTHGLESAAQQMHASLVQIEERVGRLEAGVRSPSSSPIRQRSFTRELVEQLNRFDGGSVDGPASASADSFRWPSSLSPSEKDDRASVPSPSIHNLVFDGSADDPRAALGEPPSSHPRESIELPPAPEERASPSSSPLKKTKSQDMGGKNWLGRLPLSATLRSRTKKSASGSST
ncbi:uncharacterized protein BJ171DRAFT_515184 [Polychytrium aggregatum]|uniref:uncharacterized protein n=1 Tax=Polychytrium aggregatum TaxID=110093 RepID=UPI0022FDDA54|nr:uncharacterized protein BJ171DRAFT_515184 [Polychytrium aggregatum]KAI9202201.1 hypothetical protein BJ171DRAFT_515184 [Polychytrium aggregatum]